MRSTESAAQGARSRASPVNVTVVRLPELGPAANWNGCPATGSKNCRACSWLSPSHDCQVRKQACSKESGLGLAGLAAGASGRAHAQASGATKIPALSRESQLHRQCADDRRLTIVLMYPGVLVATAASIHS